MTRALMFESQVPQSFWPEAVATSAYLLNRLPTKILDLKTPIQVLSEITSVPPSLTLQPRIFGCTVYVHIPKSDRTKFDPCAVKCVFLGYGVNQKGYRCYDPKTQKMYITMNCDFQEMAYYYTQPRDQGEKVTDSLSWVQIQASIPSPVSSPPIPDPVPNQTLEITHCESSSTGETSSTDSIPEPQSEPQRSLPDESPEVSTLSPTIEDESVPNVPSAQEEVVIERYVLPPQENRGIPAKRYSPEIKSKKARYPVANMARGSLSKKAKSFSARICGEELPTSVEEAKKSEQWRKAMEVEIEALEKNHTWHKCRLPIEKRPVGCKWVFTVKYKPDGTIERHKARLVAKGYTQTYGIDYSETFSPVAKLDTIRILFSIAANLDWPLHQFDVKNAFLHGKLKDEVYMIPPPGYEKNFKRGEVCKLDRSLYGLKQSPRAWFGRFTMVMKQLGYRQSNSDHTLFLKWRGELITCLIIYVDDMIISGNDGKEIAALRKNLFREFEMKDLGPLKYFLGIEVLRSGKGIYISQRKYILDFLTETGMLECKPTETPMQANHGLEVIEGAQLTDRGRYQRMVGKLIYLAHTRPDIAYAVGVVSQFMHKPQVHHMEAVYRIVRYLKGTPNWGILFGRNNHLEIMGYTDADWAGNPVDRRSTSGYFTFVGGNLVTWRSKKQKVVALSSAEAEFRGIARGLAELVWIRKLMTELGFPQKGPSKLHCDNKASVNISENPVQHDRTKHIEVDRHFIKEKLEGGIIELPYVRSEDQLADILTKAVNGRIFKECLSKLNVGDPTTQLEGEC